MVYAACQRASSRDHHGAASGATRRSNTSESVSVDNCQLVRQSRAERTYILLRSSSKSYYVQARFDMLKFECCDAVMSPPSVYPTLTSCRWSMRQRQEKIYIKGGRKRPTSLSSHLSTLVFVSYVYRVLDHIPLYFSGTPPAHNSAH